MNHRNALIFILFFISTITFAQSTTPIFLVSGTVKQPDGTPAANGLTVTITNVNLNISEKTTLGKNVEGEYAVIFSRVGQPVAKIGDQLKIKISDGDGKIFAEKTHTATAGEIRSANAVIDVQISLEDVEVSPTLSIVELTSDPEAIANGEDQAFIDVSLKDVRNIAVSGQRFAVAVSGSDHEISLISPTNVVGKSTFSITSTKAEEKQVTVSIGDVTLEPITIKFIADHPDQERSTVKLSEVQVASDNKSTVEIQVAFIDRYGNPVRDRSIGITSTGSENTISAPDRTNINGEAIATMISKKAETKIITVKDLKSGVQLLMTPEVEFVPDKLSPNRSQITAASPIIADGQTSSVITVTLLDQFGNAIADQSDVKIVVSGSLNEITQPTQKTDTRGKTIAHVTSTKAETKTVTAVVGNVSLGATAKIEFVPTLLETTQIIVQPISIPADGISTATISVSITDEHGNRITDFEPKLLATIGTVSPAQLHADQKSWTATYTAGVVTGPVVISALIDDIVKSSTTITLIKPEPASFRINSTSVQPTAGMTSDVIEFLMIGTPNATATVTVEGIANIVDLPMTESSPGVYTVPYTIKSNDKAADAIAIFKLNGAIDKSKTLSINISGVRMKIDFLSETSVSLGATRAIKGKLTPAVPDQLIQVEVNYPDDGNKFFNNLKTDRAGQFQFDLDFDQSGGWLVTANYAGNEVYSPTNASTVFVATRSAGKVIIALCGDAPDQNLISEAFRKTAEIVHDVFAIRTLDPDADIKFLSNDPDQTQINQDPRADLPTTLENLRSTIIDWGSANIGSASPLFIYLISTNLGPDFKIDANDTLTPRMLGEWLDQIPRETPVFIFIEASHSGNFIAQNSGGDPVLSDKNRVIVTSSHSSRQSRILPNGFSFTRTFFDKIRRNATVREAFLDAQNEIDHHPILRSQYPQIDANGNGVANEGRDLTLAADRYIPLAIELSADQIGETPQIEMISKDQKFVAGTRAFAVEVKITDESIDRVIGTVVPPSFNLSGEIDQWSDLNFEQFPLTADGRNIHRGIYDAISGSGDHLVFVHAIDTNGNVFYADRSVRFQIKPPIDSNKPTILLDLCERSDLACDLELEPGSVFDLAMRVENIEGLIGFDSEIKFDPKQIEPIAIHEGEFLKRGNADTLPVKIEIGSEKITISITRLNADGMSGGGVLAKIECRVKNVPRVDVEFVSANFSDIDALPIEVNLIDAHLKTAQLLPSWDLNQDGVIDIFDLVTVGSQLGEFGEDLNGDVNKDGVVNIFDIVLVGNHLGESAISAAPSHLNFSRSDLLILNNLIVTLENSPPTIGNEKLIDLLKNFVPPTTDRLLQNYPNPFNPETWIPFEISKLTEISIQIYSSSGDLIREIFIGDLPAGRYLTRGRAAHWDGKNSRGEIVPSGVYFYGISNSDQMRKMIILK